MSSSNLATYTIFMCPVVGRADAIDISSLSYNAISTSSDNGNLTVTVKLNPIGFNSATNRLLRIELCPEGEICSCTYSVSNLHWSVENYNLCWPDVTWTNPDANCLLRKVQLTSFRFSSPFRYEHGMGPNEPTDPLYPDGDPRNPDCVACGAVSGYEESYNTGPNMEPGDDFTIWGYFRDEACGGEDTAKSLTSSIYFETDGYVGGTVLSYTEEDGIKTYSVNVKGEIEQIKAVDMFEPEVGEWVVISKMNCYRSFKDRFTESLTDQNVCKKTGSDLKIVAYDTNEIGSGCG